MAGKTRTKQDWEINLAGCGKNAIGEIENGNRVANSNTLYRIARALSCDVGYFFGPIRAAESVTF